MSHPVRLQRLPAALLASARDLLRPVVSKWFRRRRTVIGEGRGNRTPFDAETVERWFSSETRMDSQLSEIATKLQQNRNHRPSFQQISQDLFGVDSIYAYYQPIPT
jgi:hypothetical protein